MAHDWITGCTDPKKLKTFMANATAKGETALAERAFRRLISLVPSAEPGSLEFDFWRTVNAFEHVLTNENGRTTRLSRTRQKVGRVGVQQTLADWATSDTKQDGFTMLLDRRMPELTGEAIVLRHADCFEERVILAARKRLKDAGVDPDNLAVPAQ